MRTIVPLPLLMVLGTACCFAATPQQPDPERIRALVEKLDDDQFEVREQADRELRKHGPAAVPLLETAMEKATSLEVRWRLRHILDVVGGLERKVRTLMKQLTNDSYAKRQQADEDLRKLGPDVLPLLKKEIAVAKDPEASRRLRRIVMDLSGQTRDVILTR